MRFYKNSKNILIFLLVLAVACLAVYNLITNLKDFFTTSMVPLLSVLVVIFISYFLTQIKTDERRKLDCIEKIINKIQNEMKHSKTFQVSSLEENKMALLYQKSIANKIEYIISLNIDVIKDQMKYVETEFFSLRELYGNHMHDSDYMDKSKDDIEKRIVNITDKCDEIMLKLCK